MTIAPDPQSHVTEALTGPAEWAVGEGRRLDCAILFVDLVSSSEVASVLGLREYAEFVDAFAELCDKQTRHFFEVALKGKFKPGEDYQSRILGDELIVYIHSDLSANDVYQLLCLAITLKCGWLGSRYNRERVARGMPSSELAAGIHFGPIWARRTETGFYNTGFAINVTKRIENSSRQGHNYHVFLSDTAFKQINLRMRNFVFGPRQIVEMKGVVFPIGVYEVIDASINPQPRLAPEYAENFTEVARAALQSNTFDGWIHSCLQIWEEAANGRVTDDNFKLCQYALNIDSRNAIGLYYCAQGYRERGELETALQLLCELTQHFPKLADGWLELGRVHKLLGDFAAARKAILQARRYGVGDEEEALPELKPKKKKRKRVAETPGQKIARKKQLPPHKSRKKQD